MGIMDLFSGAGNQSQQPQQPQQQPAQQQVPGQAPAQPGESAPAASPTQNGQPGSNVHAFDNSNSEGAPAGGPQGQSPLDDFKDLFNIEPVKGPDGKPITKPAGDQPFFQTDQDKLAEVIKKMDFAPRELQESMQKLQGGDMAELPNVLNGMLQQSYLQQTMMSRDMMEDLGKNVLARMEEQLPQKMRSYQTENMTTGLNPAFKHPAMRPMVQAVAQQMQQKFPNATPEELAQNVNKYLETVGSVFNNGGDDNSNNGSQGGRKAEAPDWASLLFDQPQ